MVAKLDTTRKVAILVLGAHRSGTSSIAGILDGLGCQGPKTPLEKNQWNEKGFFESRPIVCLNDKVLAAAGSKWDDWRPLCADWQKSPRFNEFRGQAMQEIVSEFGDSSLIYIKDPRICRLLPFWKEVLEGSGNRRVWTAMQKDKNKNFKNGKRIDHISLPSIRGFTSLRFLISVCFLSSWSQFPSTKRH